MEVQNTEMRTDLDTNMAPTEEQRPLTRRQQTRIKKMQKQMMAKFQKQMESHKRQSKLMKNLLKQTKKRLGKENVELLKSICTVTVPEKTNEAGEVVTAGSSYVNWDAFLAESRLLLGLLTKERISLGKRKKTSGSHSQRVNVNNLSNFVLMRNDFLKQTETAQVDSSNTEEVATSGGESSEQ